MTVESAPKTLSPTEVGEKVASLSREKEPSALREQVNDLLTKNGFLHNAKGSKEVATLLEQSQVLPKLILIEFGEANEITKEALQQKLGNSQNAFEELAAQSLLDRFDSVNGINARLNKGTDNSPNSIDATELRTYGSQEKTDDTSRTTGSKQTTETPQTTGNVQARKEVWGERGREFEIATDGSANYTVKKNDSLWAIASDILAKRRSLQPGERPKLRDIQSVIEEIVTANPEIKNKDLIHPSQVLKLPAENSRTEKPNTTTTDTVPPKTTDTTPPPNSDTVAPPTRDTVPPKTTDTSPPSNSETVAPPTADTTKQPERRTEGMLAGGKTCKIEYDESGKVSKVTMDEGGALISRSGKWYQLYDANNSIRRDDIKDITVDQTTGAVVVQTA